MTTHCQGKSKHLLYRRVFIFFSVLLIGTGSIQAMETPLSATKAHVRDLEDQLARLRQQLTTATQQAQEQFRQQLQSITGERDQTRNDLAALRQTQEQLRQQSERDLKAARDAQAAAEQARIRLEQQLAALNAERDALRGERDTARQASEQLNQRLAAITGERDALLGERNRARGDLAALRTENEQLQKDILAARAAQAESDRRLATAAKEAEDAKAGSRAIRENQEKLQQELQKAKDESSVWSTRMGVLYNISRMILATDSGVEDPIRHHLTGALVLTIIGQVKNLEEAEQLADIQKNVTSTFDARLGQKIKDPEDIDWRNILQIIKRGRTNVGELVGIGQEIYDHINR